MHRENDLVASRNYQALFGCPPSDAADVAGMQLHEALSLLAAWVKAQAKR